MRKEKETYEVILEDEKSRIITEKEREMTVYKLYELSQDKQDYIMKHINKAQLILKRTALKYYRKDFIDVDNLTILVDDSYGHRAGVRHIDDKHILYINEKFLKHMFKRKYDKYFLETLMHEMIHMYCSEWFRRDHNWSTDSSFVFCTIVMWFNKQFDDKYHIRLNNSLERTYKLNQRFLYDKINNAIKFNELQRVLFAMIIETENKLKEIQEKFFKEGRKNKDGIRQALNFCMDFNNEEYTICEVQYYKFKHEEKDMFIEFNTIYLAQDVNCKEENEDFTIEKLVEYMLDEDDDCDQRYYLNTIEDAKQLR